jgi:hypothetical protein
MEGGALPNLADNAQARPRSKAHSRPNGEANAAMRKSAGSQSERASGVRRGELVCRATAGSVLRSVSSSFASAILCEMEWGRP